MVGSKDSIVVPKSFPTILKTYAKDMIRTQPYDVLSWSAAYFRCIVDNVVPPTTLRLEESSDVATKSHPLTIEYLKTLVKQIGKGYFVDQDVLQRYWKGLSLLEADLLKYLNICGMIHWEQVHWLKLLSVMAGSMCENFASSIELMCELLSDDAEGGSNSIPFWMFNVYYEFLAELDCSVEHDVTSGESSRAIASAEAAAPALISTQNFRDALLTEWKNYIPTNTDNPFKYTQLSANFIFGNAYDDIKQSTDFEQLISRLKEIQSYKPNIIVASNNAKVSAESLPMHSDMVRLVGAPWNWMYQFAAHNSPSTKSYNFIEVEPNTNQMHTPNESCNESMLYQTDPTDTSFSHFTKQKSLDAQCENTQRMDERNIVLNDVFTCTSPAMPGIGTTVAQNVIHNFLDYLKSRSINENGLVYPRHFKESNCPSMF